MKKRVFSVKHTFMVCILPAHCSHHEGQEEHEKNKNCRTDILGFFPPVRDFKRILFFVSFVLFVVKYPSVCSSMILSMLYCDEHKKPS
jgi:ABC-type bacteriocin/lantibiotic exporter with double-glycine peptidase domain